MNVTIGQFEITRLWMLALLAVLPLLFVYARRTLVHFSRGQQRLSLAIRVLLGVLLVLPDPEPQPRLPFSAEIGHLVGTFRLAQVVYLVEHGGGGEIVIDDLRIGHVAGVVEHL